MTAIRGNVFFARPEGAEYGDLYVGPTFRTSIPIINDDRIIELISIHGGGGSGAGVVVDDIAERDALVLATDSIVAVIDASADPEVTSGSAVYIYDQSLDVYTIAGKGEVSSGGGGQVDSVVAGTGILVDSSDPANPIVTATGGLFIDGGRADTNFTSTIPVDGGNS
jgi:hypothetical protein